MILFHDTYKKTIMRFKIAFGYNYYLDIAEGWGPGNYDR